jgi:hypothetical protein
MFPADRNGVMPWWKGTVDLHEGDLEIVWGANFGSHVFQLAASEVPVGLDVSERPVAIMASVGDVWFSVRGREPFNVMVSGQSFGERVGAELFSPSGKSVWSAPSVVWWSGWRGRKAANMNGSKGMRFLCRLNYLMTVFVRIR